jgi:TolB-like protein/DNA-binding winged helix-turn-helix (wHTH) protein
MSNKEQHLYEFGPFQLNTAERQLLRDGQKISLTPKAFDTLVALIERRGRLVEKEELMSALWPDSFVEEGNLTNNVSVLRKALGDGENGSAYIETVPKVGYRFVAPSRELPLELLVVEKRSFTRVITEEEELLEPEEVARGEIGSQTSESSRLELASGPFDAKHVAVERVETGLTSKPRQGRRATTQWLLLGLLLLLPLAGFLAYRYSSVAAGRPIQSIAVLPFRNESGNPDLEYLSDGVSESLINSLSQFPRLKIIARTSAFQYKNKGIDLKEVSDALGVQAVLSGRVAQRGDDLLVSVELVDARDRSQIWGERYSRKLADIQVLERDITRAISERLRLKLSGTQTACFSSSSQGWRVLRSRSTISIGPSDWIQISR